MYLLFIKKIFTFFQVSGTYTTDRDYASYYKKKTSNYQATLIFHAFRRKNKVY